MTAYRPQTAKEWAYFLAGNTGGWLARKGRKKLQRAYVNRALATFEAIERGLGPDDICIDFGANYGTFSAKMVATGAEVHAFEPDPDTFEVLKDRLGASPNFTLHQNAVAAAAGEFVLHRNPMIEDVLAEQLSWGSSILPFSNSKEAVGVTVKVRAFKDVLAQIGRPIRLIKMDIEGSEVDILDQIVANPDAFDVETIFVETHEHQRPEQLADVKRLRKAIAKISRPDIHLYWP